MLEKYTIDISYTVKQTIEKMEKEIIKAVVVVNENKQVLGLFSNGDMRKFFLRGGSLSENIIQAMNKSPRLYSSIEEIKKEKLSIKRILYPIVDSNKVLIDVIDDNVNFVHETQSVLQDVPLVIQAGGKGTRLYPYTKILPKPLIPIGDITITERIINSFTKFGCNKVFMILNYKANMIKAYMSDLEKTYDIDYVTETEFLGTGGGLKLLQGKINSTFFLSNCDILVDADYECIYKTHKKQQNKITFVCSMKDIVIPYGVIKTDDNGIIKEMIEKPSFSFLINTGLYMIEPEVLDDLIDDEFIHLPDLAQRYINKGEKVGVFPISEKSWLDMGQFSEMENMIKKLEL